MVTDRTGACRSNKSSTSSCWCSTLQRLLCSWIDVCLQKSSCRCQADSITCSACSSMANVTVTGNLWLLAHHQQHPNQSTLTVDSHLHMLVHLLLHAQVPLQRQQTPLRCPDPRHRRLLFNQPAQQQLPLLLVNDKIYQYILAARFLQVQLQRQRAPLRRPDRHH